MYLFFKYSVRGELKDVIGLIQTAQIYGHIAVITTELKCSIFFHKALDSTHLLLACSLNLKKVCKSAAGDRCLKCCAVTAV